jgi:hypothetical protein
LLIDKRATTPILRGAPAMPESIVLFQIRMPPALHERLASLAMERRESLNATVLAILRAAAEARDAESCDDTVTRADEGLPRGSMGGRSGRGQTPAARPGRGTGRRRWDRLWGRRGGAPAPPARRGSH